MKISTKTITPISPIPIHVQGPPPRVSMVRMVEFEGTDEDDARKNAVRIMTAIVTVGLLVISAFTFTKYVIGILQMLDGLIVVDNYLTMKLGLDNGVDWAFFAPVGLLSIIFEIYCLVMTLYIVMEEYEHLQNVFGRMSCSLICLPMNVVVSFCVVIIVTAFSTGCTLYNYLIIHKILTLSPGGDEILGLFQNHTDPHLHGFIHFANSMLMAAGPTGAPIDPDVLVSIPQMH